MSCTHPKSSLLKYEPARLITDRDLSKRDYKKICRATLSPDSSPFSLVDENLILQDPYSNLCRPTDILDFLFPPIEFFNRTNHKYVRITTRMTIMHLIFRLSASLVIQLAKSMLFI